MLDDSARARSYSFDPESEIAELKRVIGIIAQAVAHTDDNLRKLAHALELNNEASMILAKELEDAHKRISFLENRVDTNFETIDRAFGRMRNENPGS